MHHAHDLTKSGLSLRKHVKVKEKFVQVGQEFLDQVTVQKLQVGQECAGQIITGQSSVRVAQMQCLPQEKDVQLLEMDVQVTKMHDVQHKNVQLFSPMQDTILIEQDA